MADQEREAGEHGGALEEGGEPSIGRPAGQTSGLRRRPEKWGWKAIW
ncbi:Hypothetical protein EPM1_0121 [Stenotrophomonas maltophilia EPM1]|nr:Hypothetical protein EPM1_0121 [Stenotrophomonas maltophilia EPM1]